MCNSCSWNPPSTTPEVSSPQSSRRMPNNKASSDSTSITTKACHLRAGQEEDVDVSLLILAMTATRSRSWEVRWPIWDKQAWLHSGAAEAGPEWRARRTTSYREIIYLGFKGGQGPDKLLSMTWRNEARTKGGGIFPDLLWTQIVGTQLRVGAAS